MAEGQGKLWSSAETQCLLAISIRIRYRVNYKEIQAQLDSFRDKDAHGKIAAEMTVRQTTCSVVRDANKKSGSGIVTCQFYEELDNILGHRPATQPSSTPETMRSSRHPTFAATSTEWRHEAYNYNFNAGVQEQLTVKDDILDKALGELEGRNRDIVLADNASWSAVRIFHSNNLLPFSTKDEEQKWVDEGHRRYPPEPHRATLTHFTPRTEHFTPAVDALICEMLKTKNKVTSAYHPQTNGLDEGTNVNIKRCGWVYGRRREDPAPAAGHTAMRGVVIPGEGRQRVPQDILQGRQCRREGYTGIKHERNQELERRRGRISSTTRTESSPQETDTAILSGCTEAAVPERVLMGDKHVHHDWLHSRAADVVDQFVMAEETTSDVDV
ncbi:hypothetical protein Bbelb_343840 [Branchiostoma belcheri]|nr:hypothetical protein Bbelb_343840 [Branchiostoma belcheri]